MKRFLRSVLIIVLMGLSCALASGQNISPDEYTKAQAKAKGFYEVNNSKLVDPTKPESVASGSVEKNQTAPGDDPIFISMSSHEFLWINDTAKIRFIAAKIHKQPISIYGRVYRAGTDGRYDGTIPINYFTANVGNWGFLQNGVSIFDTLQVYDLTYNGGDNFGEYIVDMSVVSQSGHLLQQIFTYVYFVKTGPYQRLFRIDSVSLNKAGQYVIRGKFPIGIPMKLFMGKPNYAAQIGDFVSYDGGTVLGPYPMGFDQPTEVDLAMWMPIFRTAIFKTRAAVSAAIPEQ